MLKKINIKATDDLPGVVFDPKKNFFMIYGRILPEDGRIFFNPLLEWIGEYVKEPNEYTEMHFKLDYYNSSTARMLTKLIVELEKIITTGNKVKVVWEYSGDDEVIKERGEELKSISYLPFELRAV
jgi:hypothetical protein